MIPQLLTAETLCIAVAIGAASGAIGAFIILKRMALVGDALSHVALPGIALALSYQLDPLWGVATCLLAAALLLWWLESKSNLPIDALVGLLFTASLAIGILTIPDAEVLEALFGAFPALSPAAFAIVVFSACAATALTCLLARQFLFRVISSDLAQAHGVGRIYDLLLLLIFSGVVALGIKLVGTLLMGALTIIPAAVARNLTKGMKRYLVIASGLGSAISGLGTIAAGVLGLRPGPAIILLGVLLFVLSLLPRLAARSIAPRR